jgi:peptidoglycan/LPS O-acetylase OafA/YrhL
VTPISARFVPELEGLRGIAILLVVLFHAQLLGVAGGFIGVDVFFVLSGFLITGQLVGELDKRGRIDLLGFYARRVRRVLPAALVVIGATLVIAVVVSSPLDLPDVAGDAAAAAGSVGNIRFALDASDYFSAGRLPSPFLHYWSLGVEEQFYLVWPGLLLLAGVLGRRARRPLVAFVLAAVVVVSLTGSIVMTGVSQPLAFYLLPTRAWQLGLGGLAAISGPALAAIAPWLARLAGRLGLLAIAAAALALGPSTSYPGIASLLPSLGTLAVIVSTMTPRAAPALLSARPLRYAGAISYSLYLVHWPLFVFARNPDDPAAPLPLLTTVGLLAVAVVLAALLHVVIERPIYRGQRVRGLRPRAVLAPAGAAIALVLATSAVVSASATDKLTALGGAAPVSAPVLNPAGLAVVDGSAVSGAPPLMSELGGPMDSVPPRPSPGTPHPSPRPTPPPAFVIPGTGPLPGGIRPSLAVARADWEAIQLDGCTLGNLQTAIVDCSFGDPKGPLVTLVGDSHAAQWFPAVHAVAVRNHWHLVTMTKLSCRFFDLEQISEILNRPYRECDVWKQAVLQRLGQLHPTLTIIVVAHGMIPANSADADPVRQGQALGRYIELIPGHVAVIVDTPGSAFDVPDCLARHLETVQSCDTPRSEVAGPRHTLLERTATRATGAALVDMTDAICTSTLCPAVANGMIVYRDEWHLTATYVLSLTNTLEARLPAFAASP